jgi:hypothetical protein
MSDTLGTMDNIQHVGIMYRPWSQAFRESQGTMFKFGKWVSDSLHEQVEG